jgi:hypothetical protein
VATDVKKPDLIVNHGLTARVRGKDYRTAIRALAAPGVAMMTYSEGQAWDALLDEWYRRGGLLLELDGRERVQRVYQKGTA